MTKIDREKCIGCGACVSACEKGFEMQDGKARVKDSKVDCIKDGIDICPVAAIIN